MSYENHNRYMTPSLSLISLLLRELVQGQPSSTSAFLHTPSGVFTVHPLLPNSLALCLAMDCLFFLILGLSCAGWLDLSSTPKN